jgi:hypothetical protein
LIIPPFLTNSRGNGKMEDRNKNQNIIARTLCPTCAHDKYNSDEYIVAMKNKFIFISEKCEICKILIGFYYSIEKRSEL